MSRAHRVTREVDVEYDLCNSSLSSSYILNFLQDRKNGAGNVYNMGTSVKQVCLFFQYTLECKFILILLHYLAHAAQDYIQLLLSNV